MKKRSGLEVRKIGIGKKGAGSHFEMIVAFVLFFTFMIFLLVYIKPYKVGTLRASVVDGLHDSFEQRAETNLSRFFLKADGSEILSQEDVECFYIHLDGDMFGFVLSDSLVRNADYVKRDSELEKVGSDGKLNLNSNDVYYYVMVSSEFEEEDFSGCGLLEDYELGGIVERNVISYSELQGLKQMYEEDYEKLKKDLNFPDAYDFAILSKNLPEINMEGVVPEQGDIVAQDYLQEVLFSDGTLINERFTLKVW